MPMQRSRSRWMTVLTLGTVCVGCGAMTGLELPERVAETSDAGRDASSSLRLRFADIPNVDLLFVVDDSGSMRGEQAKLRAQFPTMVRALLTGDSDVGMPGAEWPAANSLRIAVVTTDLGVAGVGTTSEAPTVITTCGADPSGPGAVDAEQARYGDDGRFRLQGRTIRSVGSVVVDCDVSPRDGTDDSVTATTLPSFLGFDNVIGVVPSAENLDEYARRVSCFTNVGASGCGFEQPLESMLKALTPAGETDALLGGRFFAAEGDAAAGLGHGAMDDPFNGGWLRNDSLLAVVLVTDEDDCSSKEPTLFDYATTSPSYDDPYDAFQSQTRCVRYESLVRSTERFVQGLLARRRGREHLLVFGAITGVPRELTDGIGAPPGLVEGSDNLTEILADPGMQVVLRSRELPAGPGRTLVDVPNVSVQPSCIHVLPAARFTVSADATDGENMLHAASPDPRPPSDTVTVSGRTVRNSFVVYDVQVPVGSAELQAGSVVQGAGIAPGTVVVSVVGDPDSAGPYFLLLSEPASRSATSVSLVLGGIRGPAAGQLVTGPGVPYGTVVEDVTGTGPYELWLSQRVTASSNAATFELASVDVWAVPARRIATVADGLSRAGANVTLQSICADDFAPAMDRILSLIQSNLAATCLGTELPRDVNERVACELTVTLPPNEACSGYAGLGHAAVALIPTTVPADVDGFLEQCTATQVPASAATLPSGTAEGWYYDDFSDDLVYCTTRQRLSFTSGARPPRGSRFDFFCAL